jgi:tRNA dimethylallyltransferase
MSAASIDPADYPRILRVLEIHERLGRPLSEIRNEHRAKARRPALVLVIGRPRAELYARIDARVDEMFECGLISEVKGLLELGFDPESPAFQAIGYRQITDYLGGRIGLDEARHMTKQATRRLAKRQLGWLRADKLGRVIRIETTDQRLDAALHAWRAHLSDERIK